MKPFPVISAEELRNVVAFEDLIEPVAEGFRAFSAGEVQDQIVTLFPARRSGEGDVYVKSACRRGGAVFTVKVAPWFRTNVDHRQPQGGMVTIFDAETGHTRAVLEDNHYLSDLRTAAAGALAARLFAPKQVNAAMVAGLGVQAFWQVRALAAERSFETLFVWGRDADKAGAFIEKVRAALPTLQVEFRPSLQQAVEDSEVVILATSSREPLLQGAWLHAAQHITAVGADDATKVELDPTALSRADRLIVDGRQASATYGCIHHALRQNQFQLDAIDAEMGDVLAGTAPRRQSETEITITKLIGLGVQDLMTAETVVRILKL